MKIRKKVYEIIGSPENPSLASRIFDILIVILIILNIAAISADTFKLPLWATDALWWFEFVSVIIFSIEYLLRVWVADFLYPDLSPLRARLKYIRSFNAVIDLLAILPFYIPYIVPIDLRVLRMLRLIRMTRIFKINRYTSALSTIIMVIKQKKHELISSIAVVCDLMIISSIIMYNIENEAQPEAFENVFSAMWWAVSTLTTVGYGDVFPITVPGKILSAIIALLGIGLVSIPTGIISAGFIENIEEKNHNRADDDEKCYCPYCGKKIR